ncbi:hypothetical protein [Priestia aryabhattai]|uniref:hypothetical protein n=1 Tax=Priestia aryabhattai TaxID=412384 RepID=UPI001C8E3D7F|nr:hypothetical protein [Priestia aryabhattai]MBY0062362.1 hypothetical protein [Priestia aryabhattai]
MNNKIVCFSAADKMAKTNYNKTVLNSVNLIDLQNKFGKLDIHQNVIYGSIWGARSSKLWENLNINDIVLFYAHKRFISYGTIMYKSQDTKIAEYLWDTSGYKNLVFMSPHIQIDSCRTPFWKAFNYAPKFYIMGLRIPLVQQQQELINQYGTIENVLKRLLSLKELKIEYY